MSNCTIFAQACVEDLIFLLKRLMLLFNFCVSTVSIVERVINKTKPSVMQICIYLISFIRGMQDVYQHHIWRLARNCTHVINSGDQPGRLGDILIMVRHPKGTLKIFLEHSVALLLEIAFLYKINYNFVEFMCFHCTICLSCNFSCEFVYIILNV